MKVRCVANTGEYLQNYSNKPDFISEYSTYGQLEIGKEYIVMGIMMVDNYLTYLIEDGVITFCPYQLFEITVPRLNANWFFKDFISNSSENVTIKAIWGYYELCFHEHHYEQLVEQEDEALQIYFKRKRENNDDTSS